MSLTADVAEAVKDSLKEGEFSEEFTPLRKWIAKYTTVQLANLRVSVLPASLRREVLDRAHDLEIREVDVAVQKKINPDSLADVDALVDLVEELIDHCHRLRLTTDGNKTILCTAQEMVPGSEAAVAREHLEDLRCFTGIVRQTWKVLSR